MIKRTWFATVQLDGNEYLRIVGPLVIVTEALGRTLIAIEPMLYADSQLRVEIR